MWIKSLIGFGKKEEFKDILAILRRQNPDRIRVLGNLSGTEKRGTILSTKIYPIFLTN